jgi:hypothetical protein
VVGVGVDVLVIDRDGVIGGVFEGVKDEVAVLVGVGVLVGQGSLTLTTTAFPVLMSCLICMVLRSPSVLK